MLQGLCNHFLSKFFVSQCQEMSYENPSVLCVRKFVLAKKFMDKKGEYQPFPLKIFRLTVHKSFVGEPYSVSQIPGTEKFYASYGYVTIFRRIFFCLAGTGKPCWGTHLCCVSQNFR